MSIDPSAGVGSLPPLPIDTNPSSMTTQTTQTQVILPLEDFAEDLDLRLGRANGNVFQRRPGIEGSHDGQVMVRLKKKRFIVIDYSIVPNEMDLQASAMNPHINVPLGAGITKCTGKVVGSPAAGGGSEGGSQPSVVQCQKVGVPVLLYDSEPNEPASLYLRSGLCFKCQRNLNEKRRTQRKKPADRAANAAAKAASKQVQMTAEQSQAAFLASHGLVGAPQAVHQQQHHQQHQQQQQYSTQNTTLQIGGVGVNQTALIGGGSTGRVNSTPHHRVLMAVTNGHKKIKLAHTNQPLVLAPDAIILNGPPDNHSCKSVRTGHGFADIGVDLQVETHQSLTATQTLLHSVGANEMMQQGIPPPTPEDISRQYDNAFYSLSKSLYLLVQWKTSWDAAIAAAVAQEAAASAQGMGSQQAQAAHHHAQQQQQQHLAAMQAAAAANAAASAAIGMPGVGGVSQSQPQSPGNAGSSLAQAVASAAAVAAATTNGDGVGGGSVVASVAPGAVQGAGAGQEEDSAVEV